MCGTAARRSVPLLARSPDTTRLAPHWSLRTPAHPGAIDRMIEIPPVLPRSNGLAPHAAVIRVYDDARNRNARGIREISKSGERCHEKQKAATRVTHDGSLLL